MQEFLSLKRGTSINHTPSRFLASDIHVEVFEAGSPTLTVDENHENTIDGESMIYDEDIDKDFTKTAFITFKSKTIL